MDHEEFFNYFKEEIKDIKKTQIKLLTEIAALKVKSGIWGFAAGLIPAIGVILLVILAYE